MKQSTFKLLAIVSTIYLLVLIIVRSIVPETQAPTITLLAISLVLVVLVLAIDLSDRATLPSPLRQRTFPKKMRARDVQYLTRQVEVAAKASPGYFDTILRNRLRDLLVEKISLENGMEKEAVKRALADARIGPELLGDLETYNLLYYSAPKGAEARLKLLRQIVERIEGWTA